MEIDSTMLKLFGYNDNYIATLEAREATELYNVIKLKMEITKRHDHDRDRDIEPQRIYGDIEEFEDEVENNFRKFKNFDLVQSSSFSFLSLRRVLGFPKNMSTEKIIAKEWEILKAQLPSSIYVRVSNSRMNFMRVAIVDDKATSTITTSNLHHGLFFFDLCFPRDYPSHPPKLRYHSYAQLHPNLEIDQSGKVSIDIFKYWCQWKDSNNNQQEESAITLKVLVWIQRLVSSRNESQSQSQTKDVLMRTCQAMLDMLASPPKEFQVFVAGYFRTRAHQILLKCKACMNLADQDLNRLFFRLIRAFEANGAYCKHHYTQQEYDQAVTKDDDLQRINSQKTA